MGEDNCTITSFMRKDNCTITATDKFVYLAKFQSWMLPCASDMLLYLYEEYNNHKCDKCALYDYLCNTRMIEYIDIMRTILKDCLGKLDYRCSLFESNAETCWSSIDDPLNFRPILVKTSDIKFDEIPEVFRCRSCISYALSLDTNIESLHCILTYLSFCAYRMIDWFVLSMI